MPMLMENPVDLIREHGLPLLGNEAAFDPVLDMVGGARFVLLGEASHGTHEFYKARCDITRRLINEAGFNAVAVEADWPDAYRVNRFVRGESDDAEAVDALEDFKRFPTWTWRNADVLDFVGWLREHNERRARGQTAAGFYGLDLYSLNSSITAVLEYLDKVDPVAARRARERYGCFEQFGSDPQRYGYATRASVSETCEKEVVKQLVELHRNAADYAHRDGRVAADDFFFAEQNARLVRNAEEYYRAMFRGRASSWNLRDRHMVETLEALVTHLEAEVKCPKIVVWAHNSHLGDARATQMGKQGQWNIGQLVRMRHTDETLLVGFTTYTGMVTAASDWDQPAQRMRVRPALEASYEELFHESCMPRFVLPLRDDELVETLHGPLLERAIGVIYRPESERWSHYFDAWLPGQFDAVLHFDVTRAVEPLERAAEWKCARAEEETYPSGL
jgi:erythromycin esterase-like protein